MKRFIRFLLAVAAPYILVFGGAGVAGLGITWEVLWLFWAGAVLVVAGLGWIGLILSLTD